MSDTIYVGIYTNLNGDDERSFGFGMASEPGRLRDLVSGSPEKGEVHDAEPEAFTPTESLKRTVNQFSRSMRAFLEIMPTGAASLYLLRRAIVEHTFQKNVVPLALSAEEHQNLKLYQVDGTRSWRMQRVMENAARQCEALDQLPGIFLLGLISEYDAFLSNLLWAISKVQPAVLLDTNKQFSASEVFECGSIEDFTEAVLAKEIESVLRRSHEEQIKYIENRFGLKILEKLLEKDSFLEVFERRNMFAHNNGRVGRSYLKKVEQAGKASPRIGDPLKIDPAYLEKAVELLLEAGMKIAYGVMRKISGNSAAEIQAADKMIHDFCYDMLTIERYGLARALLDFTLVGSDAGRDKNIEYMMEVNRAIAARHLHGPEVAKKLLNQISRLPLSNNFQLAIAAVTGDDDRLENLLLELDPGDFSIEYFFDWPAFYWWRSEPQALEKLKEIYGEAFPSDFTAVAVNPDKSG